MSDVKTWCIVEFKDVSKDKSQGNTVEAVPTEWISNADGKIYCKYPPSFKHESITKLIKNCSPPEADWVLYPIINIIKSDLGDLSRAKEQINDICAEDGYYTTASETEDAPHQYATRKNEKSKQKFISLKKTAGDVSSSDEKDEEDLEMVSTIGEPFHCKLRSICLLILFNYVYTGLIDLTKLTYF